MAYYFSDLLRRAGPSVSTNVADARDWIEDNVSRVRTNRVTNAPRSRLSRGIEPGKMYMFMYDAKYKDTLPYWDRFPLIFPLDTYPGGFMGMNLHYISPVARARLMDPLLDYVQGEGDDRKLLLSYSLLKRVAKTELYKPCVKKYLNNHVRSSFIEIKPDEWNLALFLPTERFVGARKRTVFNKA